MPVLLSLYALVLGIGGFGWCLIGFSVSFDALFVDGRYGFSMKFAVGNVRLYPVELRRF